MNLIISKFGKVQRPRHTPAFLIIEAYATPELSISKDSVIRTPHNC